MRNAPERNGAGGIQSVDRAISILEQLAGSEGELGVSELGRRLGVHKATASRLVSTLEGHRLVERNPLTEKVRLGFGVVHLAGSAMAGLGLIGQARPILEELGERSHETVNLAVLDGEGVLNVDQIAGTRSAVSVSWLGRRTPVHSTSNGKVLLAFAPDSERERLLAGPLPRTTPRTIVEREKLRTELDRVRARGWATTVEELEDGLNAVAAPVFGADGTVVAAVSVAGPAFRLRPAELPRTARLVVEAADAISRRMGHVPSERKEAVRR
jgi:IclR family transcriptional regulator, acetate operon repressor